MKVKTKRALTGYLFILPWLIGFFTLAVFPIVYSLFLSFQDVSFTPEGIVTKFAGLKHYLYAFQTDTQFFINFWNTVTNIAMSVPLIIVFSLIIAILLNSAFFGRTFFRGLYFLPVVLLSGPVIGELVANNAARIVDPQSFVVYKFISTLPRFVSFPFLYIFDNLVIILWFSGVQIVFFLAGLQKISYSIYEAAQIDGADAWVTFWKITLPLMKPFILVNTIYTIVDLSAFPNNPVNVSITANMFNFQRPYAYSSAISWIYFVSVLAFIGIVFLLLAPRKNER